MKSKKSPKKQLDSLRDKYFDLQMDIANHAKLISLIQKDLKDITLAIDTMLEDSGKIELEIEALEAKEEGRYQ